MLEMLSGVDRRNCWTIAEHRGQVRPDGLQHLMTRAVWDVDVVRDELRGYVIDVLGDAGAVLVVDETGDVKKGCTRSACNANTPARRGGSRTPRSRCS